jgi:hypothetical protein
MKIILTKRPTGFTNTEHNNIEYKRNRAGFEEESKMDNHFSNTKSQTSAFLMPKSGYCFDFTEGNLRTRKSVFLVPHVISHRDHSEIIVWRCNWGNICKSKCIYATTKNIKVTNQ